MLAVIDSRAPIEAVRALRQLGHEICMLPALPALPKPVSGHPDMLLFFAPDHILCSPAYAAIARFELSRIAAYCEKPIRVTEQDVCAVYPHDILLNALPIGDRLFCHREMTARELTALTCYRPLHVRQGYSKCAAIPIGDDALITSDSSIARAARGDGVEVQEVSCGGILLPGYDTGLIGGAASFAPYGGINEILFCGDLNTHPDVAAIDLFCRAHGKETVSLCSGQLTDVGTIFLI